MIGTVNGPYSRNFVIVISSSGSVANGGATAYACGMSTLRPPATSERRMRRIKHAAAVRLDSVPAVQVIWSDPLESPAWPHVPGRFGELVFVD